MKIVSYNIRCVWDEGDGINAFIHRAGMVYEKLRAERAEIVAFQEVKPKIEAFLRASLSDIYDFSMFYRSENYDGEGLLLATLKGSVAVDGLERFWLSPTPSVPGSRFEEQSIYPRIAVIAECREISTSRIIRVCNLHLDHISESAKVLGIRVALDRLEALQNARSLDTVILGDFNARPESETISIVKASPLDLTELTADIPVTFHAFGKRDPFVKIDYVFATEGLAKSVSEAFAWDDEHAGIYLSDHYPIGVEV